MLSDCKAMGRAELEARLDMLKDSLTDLEDALNFHYMHTSAHISAGDVTRDEAELNRLRDDIARIECLLEDEYDGGLTIDEPEVDVLEYVDDSGRTLYYEKYEHCVPVYLFDHDPQYKSNCEGCRRYGKNLACPPYSPVFSEYIGEANTAKVICVRIPLEYFENVIAEEKYRAGHRAAKKLLENELLRYREYGRVVLGSGTCLACDTCAAEQGADDCNNSGLRIYSLESLGVNVVALAEKAVGLKLDWNSKYVTADNVAAVGAAFFQE